MCSAWYAIPEREIHTCNNNNNNSNRLLQTLCTKDRWRRVIIKYQSDSKCASASLICRSGVYLKNTARERLIGTIVVPFDERKGTIAVARRTRDASVSLATFSYRRYKKESLQTNRLVASSYLQVHTTPTSKNVQLFGELSIKIWKAWISRLTEPDYLNAIYSSAAKLSVIAGNRGISWTLPNFDKITYCTGSTRTPCTAVPHRYREAEREKKKRKEMFEGGRGLVGCGAIVPWSSSFVGEWKIDR